MTIKPNIKFVITPYKDNVVIINFVITPYKDNVVIINHDAGGGVGLRNPRGVKVFPPISYLYAISQLSELGYHVELLDANVLGLSHQDIVKELNSPSLSATVIILCGSLTTVEYDIDLLQMLRQKMPDNYYVYAGTISHFFANELLDAGVSAVLSGDIEATITDVIPEITSGKIVGLRRAYLSPLELDGLPSPAWDEIDISQYTSYVILSSRGCSLACPHCPYFAYQRSRFTPRSVESVLKEIEMLYKVYQADYFLFRDPCFTCDMERVRFMVSEMNKQKIDIKWGIETRIEYLTQELLEDMAQAGLHHVRMGIEAVDEKILHNAGRLKLTGSVEKYLSQAKQVISWCRDASVYSVCFFMVGFPEDTEDTIMTIQDFVDEANPDIALVRYITPYPGTTYARRVKKEHLLVDEDFCLYGSRDYPVAKTKHLSLNELHHLKTYLANYLKSRNNRELAMEL